MLYLSCVTSLLAPSFLPIGAIFILSVKMAEDCQSMMDGVELVEE